MNVEPRAAGALGWLRSAPASSKRALLAAGLGWMFDGFDIMVYSMVLTAVIADFGMSKTMGGALGSLTLVASALGGVLFGTLADRRGRGTRSEEGRVGKERRSRWS